MTIATIVDAHQLISHDLAVGVDAEALESAPFTSRTPVPPVQEAGDEEHNDGQDQREQGLVCHPIKDDGSREHHDRHSACPDMHDSNAEKSCNEAHCGQDARRDKDRVYNKIHSHCDAFQAGKWVVQGASEISLKTYAL